MLVASARRAWRKQAHTFTSPHYTFSSSLVCLHSEYLPTQSDADLDHHSDRHNTLRYNMQSHPPPEEPQWRTNRCTCATCNDLVRAHETSHTALHRDPYSEHWDVIRAAHESVSHALSAVHRRHRSEFYDLQDDEDGLLHYDDVEGDRLINPDEGGAQGWTRQSEDEADSVGVLTDQVDELELRESTDQVEELSEGIPNTDNCRADTDHSQYMKLSQAEDRSQAADLEPTGTAHGRLPTALLEGRRRGEELKRANGGR